MLDLKKLREHLDSPEGQESMNRYCEKLINNRNIRTSQLQRAEKYDDRFEELIEKINAKYRSDEYVNRWYKRGYEPPCPLDYFILDYVATRGEALQHDELEQYAGMFTSQIYKYKGYIIELCVGQGSFVSIRKR